MYPDGYLMKKERYTLLKVLTKEVKNDNGKISTPIMGYILYDNQNKEEVEMGKIQACSHVFLFGATNCEQRRRILEDGTINTYLKLTNGEKISQKIILID